MIFLCPANEFRLKTTHSFIRAFQALKHSLTSFCEVWLCLQLTENQVFLSKLSNSGGGSHVGKGWMCSMFDCWYYFSTKISLYAGAWSWCNSQQHRVSVYSAHSLTIYEYRTSHSTRLQCILSVSNVWMHCILIWVLYNFGLYTGWFRMKGEYFRRW